MILTEEFAVDLGYFFSLKAEPPQFITNNQRIPLRVFENRVLRRIFGTRKEEVKEGENYIVRSLMICTPHPVLFTCSNRE